MAGTRRFRRGIGRNRLYGDIPPRSAPPVAVAPTREDLPPADRTPVLNPGFGVEIVQRMGAALGAGDWKSAHRELEAVTDPDQRLAVLVRCTSWNVPPAVLEEWVAGAPNVALPLLMRAAHAMWREDASRGAGSGSSPRRSALRGCARPRRT
ncbi:hypothetical protein ACSNOI_12650 [Actinomadura kijaniata]|uniref:hypothetical protein n=1 Tax=Actinomadura kijaniata TaxID=46161 RepID=UPI003F1B2894